LKTGTVVISGAVPPISVSLSLSLMPGKEVSGSEDHRHYLLTLFCFFCYLFLFYSQEKCG
jgi:hypothetical protein